MAEKYLDIIKVQLKHNAWQHLLVSILLLAASPFVLGISNLDSAQSAKVLETYVALVGILLFVPVFLPEQDRDLWDVIKARYAKITTVYLTRILISFVFSSLLTLLFLLVMKAGNCEMEPAKYYFGTMAEVIAFGGLGIFAYAVSGNLIAEYMIPLGYYAAGISAGYKYMQKLYPFGMLTDYETKYWILAAGLVLMGCGIMLFRRRRCLQLH